MVINENRRDCPNNRLDIMQQWVQPFFPEAEVFGTWTEESQQKLARTIQPIPYDELYMTLQSWRCTLTTPASGSGWATAKAWECFLVGTVCFFHPGYDTQGHILPTKNHQWGSDEVKELARFLRCENKQDFQQKVNRIGQDDFLWKRMVYLQNEHLKKVFKDTRGGTKRINERLLG